MLLDQLHALLYIEENSLYGTVHQLKGAFPRNPLCLYVPWGFIQIPTPGQLQRAQPFPGKVYVHISRLTRMPLWTWERREVVLSLNKRDFMLDSFPRENEQGHVCPY